MRREQMRGRKGEGRISPPNLKRKLRPRAAVKAVEDG